MEDAFAHLRTKPHPAAVAALDAITRVLADPEMKGASVLIRAATVALRYAPRLPEDPLPPGREEGYQEAIRNLLEELGSRSDPNRKCPNCHAPIEPVRATGASPSDPPVSPPAPSLNASSSSSGTAGTVAVETVPAVSYPASISDEAPKKEKDRVAKGATPVPREGAVRILSQPARAAAPAPPDPQSPASLPRATRAP